MKARMNKFIREKTGARLLNEKKHKISLKDYRYGLKETPKIKNENEKKHLVSLKNRGKRRIKFEYIKQEKKKRKKDI